MTYKAFEMTLCTNCGSWIDEGEDIFWDEDGDIICEDCKKLPNQ